MRPSKKHSLGFGLQYMGLPILLFLLFGGTVARLNNVAQRLVGIAAISALALIAGGLALTRQLQRKQQQLIATQEEFIAHASHELKTPIAAQRALLEVSRSDIPPMSTEEWHSFIDRALAQNSKLERLSKQLIRLNLDQSGDQPKIVNVQGIIEQTIASVRPLAASKQITITASLALQKAKFRPDDLNDILTIILDNAIKFSPEGGAITVTNHVLKTHTIISIRDQGVGMSKRDVARAFEPFYQVKATNTNGSGLGLAIAKKLAERNGSTITLARNPDRGLHVDLQLHV